MMHVYYDKNFVVVLLIKLFILPLNLNSVISYCLSDVSEGRFKILLSWYLVCTCSIPVSSPMLSTKDIRLIAIHAKLFVNLAFSPYIILWYKQLYCI